MTKFFRSIVISSIFLLNSISVQAVLIDHGTYTTDTESRLDWLDIPESINRSYLEVSGQFGAGGDYEGYRFATGSELLELINNSGITFVSSFISTGTKDIDQINSLTRLLNLIGVTSITAKEVYAIGIIADPTKGGYAVHSSLSIQHLLNSERAEIDIYLKAYSNVSTFITHGSFLVRPSAQQSQSIPEPASLAIIALGLLSLHFSSKARINKTLN